MKYAKDWDKTKERFMGFWNLEIIDRCCISIVAPKNKDLNFQVIPEKREDKIKFWTDGEWIAKRNRSTFENRYFCGDAFPKIPIDLGASGHAGYFKNARCQFEDTVWFFPFINDYSKDQIEFDEKGFLYQKTIELAKFLVNDSKGDYIVGMTDSSGNADALAHIRGSENLLMDLFDDEDSVKAALKKIQDVWLKTNETVYSIVKDNNDGGCCISWLSTWAPGRHAQIQSDMSVMISPDDYNKFILPELQAQTEWMDHSLYHFDGIEQIRHLNTLLSLPKLSAIQWTCVEGQPSPLEFIPVLKKIQAAGKSLILRVNPDELEPIMKQLSSKGLLLLVDADSPDEADRMLDLVTRLTHE